MELYLRFVYTFYSRLGSRLGSGLGSRFGSIMWTQLKRGRLIKRTIKRTIQVKHELIAFSRRLATESRHVKVPIKYLSLSASMESRAFVPPPLMLLKHDALQRHYRALTIVRENIRYVCNSHK